MPARCGALHTANPRSALIRRCDHGGGFDPKEICHDALDYFSICCRRPVCRNDVLRSHSISGNDAARTALMPSVQEMQHATDSSKLPVEVADDHQLVYPQQPSR